MMRLRILPMFAFTLVLAALQVSAQDARDPTQPPPGAMTSPDGAAIAAPPGFDAMAVVVREGKPFLVVDTRLYAPGQKIGRIVLERITETEVWLREGKELRKLPRFAGIQRRVTVPKQ
jgi:hypothetical protein